MNCTMLIVQFGKITHLEVSSKQGKLCNACQRLKFSHSIKEIEIRCIYDNLFVLTTVVLLGCLANHDCIEDWNKVDK